MITFREGPANGVTLNLNRDPMFLRVVLNGTKWDALDQIDDTPEPDEKIFVYVRVKRLGCAIVCGRNKDGKRTGGRYIIGEYTFSRLQPDDATMRDNKLWQAWVTETVESGEQLL